METKQYAAAGPWISVKDRLPVSPTARDYPVSPTARDYAGQRYYYCPTCGRMVYQPGAENCEGCGQGLEWSWWRWHCNDD